MLKAYKYRIYPKKEQQIQIAKTFGCCRFAYNQTLAYRKKPMRTKRNLSAKQTAIITATGNERKNMNGQRKWINFH